MRRATALATGLLLTAAGWSPAQNLVTNGTFDTNVDGWTFNAAQGLLFSWTDLDAHSSPSSGSGLATSSATGIAVTISQCAAAPIVAGALYDFGVKMRVSSAGVHGSSNVLLNWLSGPSCTGVYTGSQSYSTLLLDTWVAVGADNLTAPAGSQSAQIVLRLLKDAAGQTFQTYFDDIELISNAPAATTQQLFLPAAAAKHGVPPTYWSTDAWLSNRTSATVTVSGAFLHSETDNSAAIAAPLPLATLPPGGSADLVDLVTQLGVQEESGAVYLEAAASDSQPLPLVTATSYTYTPNNLGPGFYGQGIPAVSAGTESSVVVAGVFHDGAHRTNVGVLNTSAGTLTLHITVFDPSGAIVGSGDWTLAPYAHRQVSVEALGVTTLNGGKIAFQRTSGVGSFRAYTSTVDQQTGDAVYNAAQ